MDYVNQRVSIVVLAAGLGTRMKSRKAKVLHRVGGQSLLAHVLDAATGVTTPDRIVVVVGHQADAVRNECESYGVRFQLQAEQKGTGHAVQVCGGEECLTDGLLIVLYGDCPLLSRQTLERLLMQHRGSGAAATLITTFLDDPSGYGRVVRDPSGDVSSIVEQKAATPEQLAIREINSGIYCFEAPLLWEHIGTITPNSASGELYLTDIVELFRNAGHRVQPLVLEDPTEVLGINHRIELADADRVLRSRKARELMLNGVTIERPETVSIDMKVQVGMDSVIGPYAQLLGSTTMGENCTVGAGAILRNVTIEDNVEVHPYTVIDDCHLEAGAAIGPFARMRMGARLEAGAHVGNFVELKKTRLGAGSKAMHLAYLGDSDIGSKVNIGAGTITCNYDGRSKHKTQIGDGAFVGSNSTLVAPIQVGKGSYIGAGSVVTDTVPEDALALGRGRQVNKEGWAAKRRRQQPGG